MHRLTIGFLAVLFVGASAPVLAAPQILGLVASDEPVPMQCADGTCTALLSAFCLQKGRLPPDFETAYQPARPGDVALTVTTADGRQHRFDAANLVRFHSRYGYTAIRADLTLAALGIAAPASLAIEIAPLTTMLPAHRPGDADPLTAEEIALAAGPARLAAETVLEGDSEPARTARTTARLINALPLQADVPAGARDALWARVAGPDATLRARRMFDACGRTVDQSLGYPMRKCLEDRHERLQIENTHAFWDSLGGS